MLFWTHLWPPPSKRLPAVGIVNFVRTALATLCSGYLYDLHGAQQDPEQESPEVDVPGVDQKDGRALVHVVQSASVQPRQPPRWQN